MLSPGRAWRASAASSAAKARLETVASLGLLEGAQAEAEAMLWKPPAVTAAGVHVAPGGIAPATEEPRHDHCAVGKYISPSSPVLTGFLLCLASLLAIVFLKQTAKALAHAVRSATCL